ncbi:phospholipase D-like domain-containing protein [Glycomyces rhizosphaerae]|uniref:phospholipase D n=1 Tax=Glycomyces rhizosphaerae TaxID=2054422 RepID=A0ABV7Q5S3_9ACTN
MKRKFLACVSVGVFLAAATGTVTASAAGTGCTQTGDYTVCTTDPNGGKDTAIVTEVVRQIDTTRKGDTVRAAVYQWTLEKPVAPLTEALVRAEGRGVDVRAVVGTLSAQPSMNDAVISKLKAAGAQVRQCADGCLPNADGTRKGPDHNRFFLIDRGGSPSVLVTSFNFKGAMATQAHNLIGVHGDRQLFDFYSAYWSRLYSKDWTGWTDKNRSTTGSLARAWVFPRGADPVVEQLKEITGCEKGDRVLVAHANFQPKRPAVRAELDRIQGLGCQVRVVVLDKETNSPGWIKDALGSSNVRVHDAHRNKYIVAEASFGGRHRSVVWTGTHNLNGNAMKHADDNLIRVASRPVADLYAQHFQQLWNGAN